MSISTTPEFQKLKALATFNLAGTLDSSATDFTQVGTITVTLA